LVEKDLENNVVAENIILINYLCMMHIMMLYQMIPLMLNLLPQQMV
jgi:hypothetical protein